MRAIKPCNESYLEEICINVRRQLLASNAITTKARQFGIQDTEVIVLLDGFINGWIEHYNKNSIELKNLTGWILLNTIKRNFLNNFVITHHS
jgi:hypothetical protein